MPHLNKKTYLQTWSAYLSKRSKRKLYPCHILKSSSSVWDTSLESLRKQDRPANISTISKGERSSDCCMFWTHVDRHSFSENILKRRKKWLQIINVAHSWECPRIHYEAILTIEADFKLSDIQINIISYGYFPYIQKETQMLHNSHNFLILECYGRSKT